MRDTLASTKNATVEFDIFQDDPAVAGSETNENVMVVKNTRLQERIKRQSRTHSLLVSIVVVFALSWFPLNMLNLILDINHNFFPVR